MRLATTTGDFSAYTSDQRKSMEYVREGGFRYLDYNFGMDYNHRNGIFGGAVREYLEDVKRTADKLGVQFVQAHAPMGDPIAADNLKFTEDTIACIEACHELQIPNIVVHSGYERNLTKEQTFDRNKSFFGELLRVAEKYNIHILAENFNKMVFDDIFWVDNAEDLAELIDYVDHPLFQAVWDAGHGNMQEMTQEESLKKLGKRVYALHIQDNLGDEDIHIAPFFGTLNPDDLMNGLLGIDYRGYFTFEAGNILLPYKKRRVYEKDQRLLKAPLSLRIQAEKFLYETGKTILSAYHCFEE